MKGYVECVTHPSMETYLVVVFVVVPVESLGFAKEYIPPTDSEEKGGGSTILVVSLVVEIEGDETK